MGTAIKKIILLFAFFAILTGAHASPENDRLYQLETLSWIKASDNVDGVFGEYMNEQYERIFSKQSRFIIKPVKRVDEVLSESKERYHVLIDQPEILRKIAQKFQVENLIRTKIYKEGESYRFVLEWVYAPKGDVLSSVEFRFYDEGKDNGIQGSELPLAIEKGVEDLIQGLPFLGQVTGVEESSLTLSMGRNQGLNVGDSVTLSTLQAVKRHPLLKSIEEWRWQTVGKAVVEQVEESISFAKVTDLEPGMKVIRLQKVREILAAPEKKVGADGKSIETDPTPRSGWVAGNLGIGSYSREFGAGSGTGRGGGGLGGLVEVDTQIWLNSRYLMQGSLGAGIFTYNPTDISTGTSLTASYSGSLTQFRLAGGYSLFEMKSVFDPIVWVHAGYKTTSYSLSTSAADYAGGSTQGALFIGIGGEMPFNEEFGGQLGIDLGLFRSASADTLGYGSASSTADLSLKFGASYRLQPRFYLRGLISISSQSMEFTGGESLSQKFFSIVPSLMYYF